MPLTESEQRELDELELEKLEHEKSASTTGAGKPYHSQMKVFGADLPPAEVTNEIFDKMGNMGIRAVGPAMGQAIGALGGPLAEVTVPLGGAIGGAVSEGIANKREGTPNTLGKLASAAITGAIPGASLVNSGAKGVAKEAAKYAAGSAAGQFAESGLDRGELPDPTNVAIGSAAAAVGAPFAKAFSVENEVSAARRQFQMQHESFLDLRKEGIKVPPHQVGEGSDFISSLGGKAALSQQAAQDNAPIFQKLAREEIGLTKDAVPIASRDANGKLNVDQAFREVRQKYYEPYEKLQAMSSEAKERLGAMDSAAAKREQDLTNTSSPQEREMGAGTAASEKAAVAGQRDQLIVQAAADVDVLKDLRSKAQKAFDSMQNNPAAYEQWQGYKKAAEDVENSIEQAASQVGDQTLLARLKESRKKIAQSYTVQAATNRGTGLIDPAVLGALYEAKEPLTGNLERIAKFQLGFNREAVEATRIPSPSVNNLGGMATTEMASRGTSAGVIGAIANATAGKPARKYMLSSMYQNSLLQPDESQNFLAAFSRYASQAAGPSISR